MTPGIAELRTRVFGVACHIRVEDVDHRDDDIATIGKQPDGANWLVGVKYPKGSGVAITRLKLNNRGYSVRGGFERCINIDKELFGNALSPIDGHPIPGLLSVGVMANSCVEMAGKTRLPLGRNRQAVAMPWASSLKLFPLKSGHPLIPFGGEALL